MGFPVRLLLRKPGPSMMLSMARFEAVWFGSYVLCHFYPPSHDSTRHGTTACYAPWDYAHTVQSILLHSMHPQHWCPCVFGSVFVCLFVTNHCPPCRLIPSSTPFLSFSSLVYTSEAPEPGLIAPGMHVGVTVTFTPNSLHDVDDVMVVETGQGSLQVPLLVRRDPPTLTLPQQILIGPTLVSNKQVCDI